MRLIHYTSKPFMLDRSYSYTQGKESKPDGLWVSVEGPRDWKEWCEDNAFHPEALVHESTVVLAPTANIKYIRTAQQFDEFHDLFQEMVGRYITLIRWPEVAERWDGIIIAPHRGDRRLYDIRYMWYHSWDCASGAIWNLGAIERVESSLQSIAN